MPRERRLPAGRARALGVPDSELPEATRELLRELGADPATDVAPAPG